MVVELFEVIFFSLDHASAVKIVLMLLAALVILLFSRLQIMVINDVEYVVDLD